MSSVLQGCALADGHFGEEGVRGGGSLARSCPSWNIINLPGAVDGTTVTVDSSLGSNVVVDNPPIGQRWTVDFPSLDSDVAAPLVPAEHE
jgi:hypothetical protein